MPWGNWSRFAAGAASFPAEFAAMSRTAAAVALDVFRADQEAAADPG